MLFQALFELATEVFEEQIYIPHMKYLMEVA